MSWRDTARKEYPLGAAVKKWTHVAKLHEKESLEDIFQHITLGMLDDLRGSIEIVSFTP